MTTTGLTQEQMQQIESVVRRAVREEISEAGLRLDDPDHVDSAREDFRFVRKFRLFVDGIASKIGWAIIAALISAGIWIFTQGMNFWKGS